MKRAKFAATPQRNCSHTSDRRWQERQPIPRQQTVKGKSDRKP